MEKIKFNYWWLLIIPVIIALLSKRLRNSLVGYLSLGLKVYPDEISNRIFRQAKKRGISDSLAALMVAWAKFETGQYKSHFVTDNNNLYGYIYDKNSKYQIGSSGHLTNGYSVGKYSSIEDSVNENIDWMRRRYSRQDRGTWPDLETIVDPMQLGKLLMMSNYSGDTAEVYGAGIRANL